MADFKVGDRVQFTDYDSRTWVGVVVSFSETPTGRAAWVETPSRKSLVHVIHLRPAPPTPPPLDQPPLPPVDVSYVAPHYDPPGRDPQQSGVAYALAYLRECWRAVRYVVTGRGGR